MSSFSDSIQPFTLNEGRHSERCRRVTFMTLFTREGAPNGFLVALLVICAAVAVKTLAG